MENIKEQAFKNSLYISILYVGVGTLGLFAISSSIMENDVLSIMILLINLITMPVIFVGFGIRYGGGEGAGLLAFGAQLIIFLLFWLLLYRYLLNRYKRQLR